ncbi:hypothetical protein LJC61_02760 [Ruminococcaceae bacterium OttesenSCG-928-A16]|nr:hypothetical protein [Ruminococcaceae bacterium OttesenSCG-928-A16]
MESQMFNDGVVKIYTVENIAPNGAKPDNRLVFAGQLRYAERVVGLNRFTQYMANDVEVSYLLRCLQIRSVSTQNIAVPNDGEQYRIVQIQYPKEVTPPCMDLTLQRLETVYEYA